MEVAMIGNQMSFGLEEQVALITGGAGGIGTAITNAFSQVGAKAAITYHANEPAAQSLVRGLQAEGREAFALSYDMGDYVQATTVVDQVVKKWGRLDILIANAVNWPIFASDKRPLNQPSFTETDFRAWTEAVNVNEYGTAAIIREASKQMIKQKYGRIVIVSTEIAIRGMAGGTPYSTAKAAIHGLVASLRWELGAHNILINLVAPGFTMTPRNLQNTPDEIRKQAASRAPTTHLSTPEDVAPTIVFLASPLNRNTTGEFIMITGGAD
jgi:3-oxoacyl-[acyl-carrier protein] reductase